MMNPKGIYRWYRGWTGTVAGGFDLSTGRLMCRQSDPANAPKVNGDKIPNQYQESGARTEPDIAIVLSAFE